MFGIGRKDVVAKAIEGKPKIEPNIVGPKTELEEFIKGERTIDQQSRGKGQLISNLVSLDCLLQTLLLGPLSL